MIDAPGGIDPSTSVEMLADVAKNVDKLSLKVQASNVFLPW